MKIHFGYNWEFGTKRLGTYRVVKKVRFLDHNEIAIEYENEPLLIVDNTDCQLTLEVFDDEGMLREVWCMPDAVLYGGGKHWVIRTKWWECIREKTKLLKETNDDLCSV
jgi:hypothetical protein